LSRGLVDVQMLSTLQCCCIEKDPNGHEKRNGTKFSIKFFNHIHRAANNGRSTVNVQSEMGIDWTNLWMAGHDVRSLPDSLREILVFNYLTIVRGSIHVSRRTKNEYKTRQTSGQEEYVIKSCRDRKSSCLPLIYLL